MIDHDRSATHEIVGPSFWVTMKVVLRRVGAEEVLA